MNLTSVWISWQWQQFQSHNDSYPQNTWQLPTDQTFSVKILLIICAQAVTNSRAHRMLLEKEAKVMVTHKCNDNKVDNKVVLPLPPEDQAPTDMDIYARFMRHLRNVPNSRMEIKILSAIQFTADMLDIGDALVAKTLVDCGLRAPRQSFPAEYLEFIDKSLLRSGWEVGGPSASAAELKAHWDKIGEDKFAPFRRSIGIPETVLVES